MARLDASGRFSARQLLRALGWPVGHRFDVAIAGDAVVFGSSATGRHAVGSRGELAVPASARALLELRTRQRIVLVAAPAQDTLVVHPAGVLSRLLIEHYTHQQPPPAPS